MFTGRKHPYTDQSSTAGGHPEENGLSKHNHYDWHAYLCPTRRNRPRSMQKETKEYAEKMAKFHEERAADNEAQRAEDCDKAAEPTTPWRTARSMYCVPGDRVLFVLLKHIE
ncbi:hypothetical protein THAR02_04158 [Trichoderma harzianum]|uniref:Uncharacterized protein n=1 Tax=Trichoderma harzianum TaxID=5544 RepID=A0A0F9XF85_TRIHA|nr:hypothetical protein THAR02_04158 [Trichoderma harzianum]